MFLKRTHSRLSKEIGVVFRRKLQDNAAIKSQNSKGVFERVEMEGLRPLYLDAQATTPLVSSCDVVIDTDNGALVDTLSDSGEMCFYLNSVPHLSCQRGMEDPRVLDAMLPFLTSFYGNPHSRTHAYGWESEKGVEHARKQVASLIGADPKEIIFTSGASESNNIAVKGVPRFYSLKRKHVITTQTEHKCVLDSCRMLQNEKFDVTYLPVQKNGQICLEKLEQTIRPDTVLVSIMAVNNEIGVTQPLKEIGRICRSKNVFFHTDAAQAVGKIPIDVNDMNIDLLSISGHKIYGPKGVGALYARRKPRVRMVPLQSGGGQERGIRSGTVPTPIVVGLGAACEICSIEMEYDHGYIEKLSRRLVDRIMSNLTHVIRNGDAISTYPGCVNLSFAYVEGESLLMALKDVALSSGSACTSASLEPSYVLRAIGADEDLAHSSIRFGIGRFTTEEEIDYTADKCIFHVKRLREMSPLWEMVQEGIDLKAISWAQH